MPKVYGWRHALWAAPLTVAIAAPSVVFAQDREVVAIDEIVVTARKREETLQDVPLPVTALTAEQIKLGGIKSVEDAIQLDPSLNFDTGFAPADTRIVIRGLSPTRGRPNVATLVDGIDVSSEAVGVAGGSLLINPKLLDISRIEVVKGPQSALYGRSAFAGAIQYVTKDPAKEFEAEIGTEFGNYDLREYRAEISAPIINDLLGFRITGLKYEQDGYYNNQVSGKRVGGVEGEGVALSLKLTPTDSLDFKLRYEYSHDAFQQGPQASVGPNDTSAIPTEASSCNGGPVADSSCAQAAYYFLTDPVGGTGLTRGPAGTNLAYLLENRLGNPGIFNDATQQVFNGSLGDAAGRQVRLSPDWSRSTDGGLTGPDFPGSDRNVNRVSLVANWNTDFGTFSSLTGYTDARVSSNADLDKLAVIDPITGRDVSTIQQSIDTFGKTWQTSQELRFTSDFDGPLNFITGLQYWKERVSQSEGNYSVITGGTRCQLSDLPGPSPLQALAPGTCGAPGSTAINPAGVTTSTPVGPWVDNVLAVSDRVLVERETDHQSAYLQIGWQIADRWSASVEGRYVDEDNSVLGPDPVETGTEPQSGAGSVTLCGSNGPCTTIPNGPRGFGPVRPIVYRTFERNDSYFTPRVNLDWRATDDAMLYLSYSQGQKPGGFSTLTVGSTGMNSQEDIEFDPEKMAQYELGWKTTWLDRRLIVNGSLFYIDFTDKQVSTQEVRGEQLAPVIKNAGGAEVKGLELSAQYRPIAELTLAAAYTYLDAEYTDYVVEATGAAEIARVGNCDLKVNVLAPASPGAAGAAGQYSVRPVCDVSRTGNTMEDTPEHAFSAQVGWRQPLASTGFDWFADLTGRYQSKRFLEDDNTIWLDGYWLADARIGVDSDSWTLVGFVDNLFDDDTIKSAGTGPGISSANFRLGQLVAPGQTIVTGGRVSGIIASPSIPTLVFATLPDPRTYRVQVSYKFN